jgi:hypothetical protein
MKMKTLLSVGLAVAALQFAPSGFAQTGDGTGHGRRWRHQQMLANLSPDERGKLRAAHQKAMADPAVQAAKDRLRQAARDFRELKRQTMLRNDPTIQPILDKMPNRGPRGT